MVATSRAGTVATYGGGILVGLILGLALRLLRDWLRSRHLAPEAIGGILHAPLLGKLPTPGSRREPIDAYTQQGLNGLDAGPALATNLEFLGIDQPVTGIVVAGMRASEGSEERALRAGALAAIAALAVNALTINAWTLAPIATVAWLVLGAAASPRPAVPAPHGDRGRTAGAAAGADGQRPQAELAVRHTA